MCERERDSRSRVGQAVGKLLIFKIVFFFEPTSHMLNDIYIVKEGSYMQHNEMR